MLHFQIVTLSGIKFDTEVYEVQLPTPEGHIGVFEHHMPLVSLASPGVIAIRHNERDTNDKIEYYATDGGVIEILDNRVRLLTDDAVDAESIVEDVALKALESAKNAIRDAKDQVSLEKAQAMIDRQAVRLDVAKYKRKNRR